MGLFTLHGHNGDITTIFLDKVVLLPPCSSNDSWFRAHQWQPRVDVAQAPFASGIC